MEIEYLRTSRKSYMIVKDADYVFENYELQMILHNEIPNLLEFQVIVGDGTVEYWYDVTGMQPLEKQYSVTPLDESQLRFFLQNLVSMKNAMEEYLLDDHNLSYSLSMVYYDRFMERIRFCYIPGLAEQHGAEIKDLFGEMLQYLNHSDASAVRLGYEMYERSMRSEFLVEDCVECLTVHAFQKESRCDSNEADGNWHRKDSDLYVKNNPETWKSDPEWDDNDAISKMETDYNRDGAGVNMFYNGKRTELGETASHRGEERSKGFWKKKRRWKKRRAIDYSEILDEEQHNFYAAEEIQGKNETQYLSGENMATDWKLIYKGDGDESDFELSDFPFLLGTDREKVQGVLFSRTVSRVHARLYLEDENLYLEDYNSTNGTYVNHRLLPMNTPVQLQPGDFVVFATESYMVSCRRIPKA